MNHDGLDRAIDQVAARLVAVPDDHADLTQRIVSRLPGRSPRVHWLVPQLAAISAVAIAAVIWSTRDRSSAPLVPASIHVVPSAPPLTVAAQAPQAPYAPFAPQAPDAPYAPYAPFAPKAPYAPNSLLVPAFSDHPRALAAIETVTALVIDEMSPGDIAAPALLELAPIEISEMPMTTEFPPRR